LIKQGAKIQGLQPEMVLACILIKPILAKYKQDFVITEGTGGEHSQKSRHYIGYAVDVRTRDIANDAEKIRMSNEVRSVLGDEYYIKLHETHLHIQFNGSVNL